MLRSFMYIYVCIQSTLKVADIDQDKLEPALRHREMWVSGNAYGATGPEAEGCMGVRSGVVFVWGICTWGHLYLI